MSKKAASKKTPAKAARKSQKTGEETLQRAREQLHQEYACISVVGRALTEEEQRRSDAFS